MKIGRLTYFIGAIAAIGLALGLRLDVPDTEAAFGVSPPWVTNDHLLPGSTYEQIINLSRNDASRDMMVTVEIDGDKEIEKWLKIENEDNLILKEGETILPMKVVIKVPRRAAIKDYKGGIFVTLESVQEDAAKQGGTVAIRLGAHISVDLSVVGDKIIDYRIKSASIDTLYEGDAFLLNVEIENLGNTEISELNGQVDIYNKDETEILQSVTFGKLEETISPDDILKTMIRFQDIVLDPGEYWVVAKFFKDNETLYENRLYQKVEAKAVPIVTPEDAGAKKPSIPKIAKEEETGEMAEGTVTLSAETQLRETAPAEQQDNRLFVIFGLVGLGFGLFALTAIIILLVVLIKNQRQSAIQRYLTQQNTNNQKL